MCRYALHSTCFFPCWRWIKAANINAVLRPRLLRKTLRHASVVMVVQCFESFSIIDIVDILFLVFLCEIFIRNTFFFALQCVIDDSDDGIRVLFQGGSPRRLRDGVTHFFHFLRVARSLIREYRDQTRRESAINVNLQFSSQSSTPHIERTVDLFFDVSIFPVGLEIRWIERVVEELRNVLARHTGRSADGIEYDRRRNRCFPCRSSF